MAHNQLRWLTHLIIAGGMSGLMAFLGFYARQNDFGPLAFYYGLCFGLYLWVVFQVDRPEEIRFYVLLGIALRILLLFAFPQLSDDVYRFIWDGHLTWNGINPFEYRPEDWMQRPDRPAGLTPELFERLNSPAYFTVYPPLAQLTFAAGIALGASSWAKAVLVMKLFLLAAETGLLWLIPRILRAESLPAQRILIYAINPLVILEVMGNLHYEGLVAFFMLLGGWWLYRKRYIAAAMAMALSIAAKLSPLMVLPFFIRRLNRRQSLIFFGTGALILLLLFLPVLSSFFWGNVGKSLNLYFRRFEFNGGIYYAIRWLGYQVKGYNIIYRLGPWLAFHTLTGILIGAWIQRDMSLTGLFRMMLFAFSLYLFLATTVHPWYLVLPLALCCFTGFRFPLIWTGMAILSYSRYDAGLPMQAYYVWVALEYVLVIGWALWELRQFALGQLR